VEVLTEDGERIGARAVIAALPMNVIVNIRFSPALQAKKVSASRERHNAAGVKVYAKP
ncbi:FAD-dependent oxidoreductase, partial [bacterium]